MSRGKGEVRREPRALRSAPRAAGTPRPEEGRQPDENTAAMYAAKGLGDASSQHTM